MEIPDMPVTINEPASNPNNCGKRGNHFSGCTEYRAAFNWPPGSTTINHQIVNNSGPITSTTVTTTSSISLDNVIKPSTTTDFSEISATSINTPAAVINNQPAKSTSYQLSLAPGAAGLPSYSTGGGGIGDRNKDRPQVLFTRATPSPPVVDHHHKSVKPSTKTEYKKKFKPFSTYVYIPGSGWKKSKQISREAAGSGFGGGFTSGGESRSTSEGALEWYGEVVERAKKACEFRSRSQFGHPIVGVDHLESIYRETSSNLWNQPRDRSIAALALATSNHLRVSTRTSKGNSRDSSRDSSKAGSDRVTASSHLNAIISPTKEAAVTKKQFADKSKSAAASTATHKSNVSPRTRTTSEGKSKPDKKRSGGLTTTPVGTKSNSGDSEGGKIWLKPKKEEKPAPTVKPTVEGDIGGGSGKKDSIGGVSCDGDKNEGKGGGGGGGDTPVTTGGASSLGTSGSLTPLLSPREKEGDKDGDYESGSNATKSPNYSDDQPRSPRPNSLVSSFTNGGSGLASPPSGFIIDGPVKTTEIKSPEEVTGVKSPSPELYRVSIETGANINWTEAKPATTIKLIDNDNDKLLTDIVVDKESSDNGIGDKSLTIEKDANNLANQLGETINKQSETQATSSEASEDLYGPLSI